MPAAGRAPHAGPAAGQLDVLLGRLQLVGGDGHDALAQDLGRVAHRAGGHGPAATPGRPGAEAGDGGVALDGVDVVDVHAQRVGGELHHGGLDAVALPQSSCSFKPQAPAQNLFRQRSRVAAFPLPRNPKFIGHASAARNIRSRFQAPGVQVVALVPVAGPVPPPIMVVMPFESAS